MRIQQNAKGFVLAPTIDFDCDSVSQDTMIDALPRDLNVWLLEIQPSPEGAIPGQVGCICKCDQS